MSGLNFDEILKQQRKTEKKKKEACKKVYTFICNEIIDRIKKGIDVLHYNILLINMYDTEYDPLYTVDYIVTNLCNHEQFKKMIVDIQVKEPCILYIKWDNSKLI